MHCLSYILDSDNNTVGYIRKNNHLFFTVTTTPYSSTGLWAKQNQIDPMLDVPFLIYNRNLKVNRKLRFCGGWLRLKTSQPTCFWERKWLNLVWKHTLVPTILLLSVKAYLSPNNTAFIMVEERKYAHFTFLQRVSELLEKKSSFCSLFLYIYMLLFWWVFGATEFMRVHSLSQMVCVNHLIRDCCVCRITKPAVRQSRKNG